MRRGFWFANIASLATHLHSLVKVVCVCKNIAQTKSAKHTLKGDGTKESKRQIGGKEWGDKGKGGNEKMGLKIKVTRKQRTATTFHRK